MTEINPREIAAHLMIEAARDVERMSIREYLDEEGIDDPGRDITDQVSELISTADLTIGWPNR